MSKALKSTFLIHAVVAFLFGASLLFIPGTLQMWIGWPFRDRLISRVLGAALLALAWSSFRGWRATKRAQVAVLVEMEAIFTVLSCVGLLRHLLLKWHPPIVWIVLAVLAIFAIAWAIFLLKRQSHWPPLEDTGLVS
jgi:hypothetical protein